MDRLLLPELAEWVDSDLYRYLINNNIWIPKVGDIVRTGYWSGGDTVLPDIEYKVTASFEHKGSTTIGVQLEACGSRCPCCLRFYPTDPMVKLDSYWIQPYHFRTKREWYFAMQQMVVDHIMG
jgi:hypothetical protein